VIVRSSNYSLYGDMSARVMRILGTFTPHLEIYSIDEAFLGLQGFGNLERHARAIRAQLLQWTGLPVSIGIAPTKTLAKVANRLAKKDPDANGVRLVVTREEQEAALTQLQLTDLWGVAARLAKRLNAIGITTPLDLRNADPQTLRQHAGVVMERMSLELKGIPCHRLTELVPQNKSIMVSRSFGKPITQRHELEQAVSSYTERAAAKMRRQNLACATLQVFVTTNRFKPAETQYTGSKTVSLPVATSDSTKLAKAALNGMAKVWRPNLRYKKAGVILLDLSPAASVQGDLWDSPDTRKSKSLMKALDRINAEYGRDTISLAASGRKRPWGMRSERRSPRYTTDWDELLKVA
jgi:DNA polymerase V